MDKLPTTSHIFIDRRKTGRGKSLPNRQRLLRRIRGAIKAARPKGIVSQQTGVKGLTGGGKPGSNPVSVARGSLHEPTFHYDSSTGEFDVVLIGNDVWERGDEFPLISSDSQAGGSGPGEDGEDDFIVNVSTSEYLDIFFEDCHLPDLRENSNNDSAQFITKPAGFQKDGVPGQLDLVRSYRNSLPRYHAMQQLYLDEIERHEQLLAEALEKQKQNPSPELDEQVQALQLTIARLKDELQSLPLFEKMDLRYHKREKIAVKEADAVFIMIMDVSGSMDEEKKSIARHWFSLQYAFIKRRYPQTDLVFISHTDTAEEVTEEEFFKGRRSGGTIVSGSYELALSIIKERYNANNTNIYISQASDGDNWADDNDAVYAALSGELMSKLRHMTYAQVGQENNWFMGNIGNTLWATMVQISGVTRKLDVTRIVDKSEIYDKFLDIYKATNR